MAQRQPDGPLADARVGEIGRQGHGRTAERRGGRVQLLVAARDQDDLRPVGDQGVRGRPPEAAGRRRHDEHLAG